METKPSSPLHQRIQGIISEAIQVPIELVTTDLAFGDLPQWDSMGHMEVMMLLEQYFGIEINAENIAKLISIPEIYAHLRENGHVN